jgi:DNA-binding transcriptional ArsR family regulator
MREKKKEDDSMSNNFLLISLEENKAKKIAEAINNPTGRKILDALAKKEYTETDLSRDLNIPISTVHYNLKQLIEANLVIVDEFHYSAKGKEVNHYKLANKYIIIAPKQDNNKFMEALKKIMPLTVITVIAGGLLTIFGLINSVTSSKATSFQEAAPRLMAASASAGTAATSQAANISRPFLQSEFITWFLIGALSIIIIYFIYEMVRKT